MQPVNAGISHGLGLIKMNGTREILELNLTEAAKELRELISRLEAGACEDAEIAVRLKGVFWHLRAAWNGRDMTFQDVNALALSEFDSLGATPVELPGETPI